MNNTKAKKYNTIKLVVGITKGITAFILLLLFVWMQYSAILEEYIRNYTSNNYLILLIFSFSLGLFSSVLFFPIKYFVEFYLEHKYNLSNQTFWKWIWEDA